jgi:hypothetical protein
MWESAEGPMSAIGTSTTRSRAHGSNGPATLTQGTEEAHDEATESDGTLVPVFFLYALREHVKM